MKKFYRIKGLDCANCAAKLEREISKIQGVKSASVNFLTQKITIEIDHDDFQSIEKIMIERAAKIEPDCVIEVK